MTPSLEVVKWELHGDDTFHLYIKSDSGYEYRVDYDKHEWRCSCPHHMYRKVSCKHITKAQEHVKEWAWVME